MDERDFWINQATIDDIAGQPPMDADSCLDVIIPEIRPALLSDDWVSLLEIGCGTGRLTYKLQALFPTAIIRGIDISPRFISMAENDRRMPKPHFHLTDKIVYGPYNAVYSMLVFQHIPDHAKYSYILRVAKNLKPGGILCFQYVEGDTNEYLMHDTSLDKVKRWCESAGLKITNIQENLLYERWTWITAIE